MAAGGPLPSRRTGDREPGCEPRGPDPTRAELRRRCRRGGRLRGGGGGRGRLREAAAAGEAGPLESIAGARALEAAAETAAAAFELAEEALEPVPAPAAADASAGASAALRRKLRGSFVRAFQRPRGRRRTAGRGSGAVRRLGGAIVRGGCIDRTRCGGLGPRRGNLGPRRRNLGPRRGGLRCSRQASALRQVGMRGGRGGRRREDRMRRRSGGGARDAAGVARAVGAFVLKPRLEPARPPAWGLSWCWPSACAVRAQCSASAPWKSARARWAPRWGGRAAVGGEEDAGGARTAATLMRALPAAAGIG